MDDKATVVAQTRQWIQSVVIGCNFCPFAARELQRNSIHYQVETGMTLTSSRAVLLRELQRLDADKNIETTLLILPGTFAAFHDYLALVRRVEHLLQQKGYQGIYQVATFHPLYQFEGSTVDDAANFTNRSIYPMLHLLREASIRKALAFYGDAEKIPARNVQFAREKGSAYLQMLRDQCL
ncbi:hypothetical protein GA0116948_110145 [Chitinophaga costaii]|uniref:DUF1415 domain-containing protein n=1 Tax=Chitinophaga costaii TaxID=1335309 RepID=A0A1C4EZL7_9BACT|nr:DUF1415 domain-containing protein [Chitinophaga costaii]PUZ21523.1 DUF1415 domain-containing protein [Chitinophaga costaii]SCC48961.1 hypothetical protein GA0116948_110145 [Chitinophaga costaii]